MIETIAVGIAVAAVGIAVVSVLVLLNDTSERNAPRRESRFGESGEVGGVPWSGSDGDCDPGTSSDAGCADGGGDGD
jgi:hypothetical protein